MIPQQFQFSKPNCFMRLTFFKTFLYLVLSKTLTKLWPDHNHFFKHKNKIYRFFFSKLFGQRYSILCGGILIKSESIFVQIIILSGRVSQNGVLRFYIEKYTGTIFKNLLFQKLFRKVETFVELFSGNVLLFWF